MKKQQRQKGLMRKVAKNLSPHRRREEQVKAIKRRLRERAKKDGQ